MTSPPLPDDLRRFILTSVASVPHLEALLLLRSWPEQEWDSAAVAQRLYVAERAARRLLEELCTMGALAGSRTHQRVTYRYWPRHPELAAMIDLLAQAYASNLVAIAGLIHSKTDRQAQQFADAFTWRKDV
ncbi:hypothetical protein [Duganella violaceipulchra]|uniref:Uncharacterized protein n=1 Tax=Duganella violaceipulchra TaxID=2849652 RepID=A0AA41HCW7_9BURK|nr:hypothetical protein [Duganella violaceicalia]MBV6323765.1 hypothetical protein [Duganella violaceicalia]MCP2007455.1 hypothetical protein [Duganella violaceicalia]